MDVEDSAHTPYRAPALPAARPHPPLEWRPQQRTALIALGITAVAAAIELWDGSLQNESARLHPDLVAAANFAPLALLATTVYLVVALVREAAWTVSKRPVWVRVTYLGGSVLCHVAFIAALSVCILFCTHDWLFGQSEIARQEAPDGSREGFLYGCGLMTSPSIYYRAKGSLVLHKGFDTRVHCDALPGAKLHFGANGEAEAVGPDGQPLPIADPPAMFRWGGC